MPSGLNRAIAKSVMLPPVTCAVVLPTQTILPSGWMVTPEGPPARMLNPADAKLVNSRSC